MQICIVVDDYIPNSTKIAAKMMHQLACGFESLGHEVYVITPFIFTKIKKIDGVNILYYKNGPIKNVNMIRRAINETFLSFNAWRAFRKLKNKPKFDIIVSYSPSIFFGDFVSKLKKDNNSKVYLVLRDLFPQWAIDTGLIKKGSIIEKYFRYFESKNYDSADTIGLMSKNNLVFFESFYNNKNNKKIEVLYNWSDNFYKSKTNIYKKKLGLEDKVVYFYGGNMGYAQDMMNIVRLAKNMLNQKKAHFVLVGKGDEFNLIKNSIKKYNLVNMTLLNAVSQEEYMQMLSSFDVGLITLHKEHKTHNFPGKILGYMTQGMPILGSVNQNNDIKDVIEESNAGFISINGNDDIFYENAVKLLDDKTLYDMGKNSHNLLLKKFSTQSAINQILSSCI